MKTKKNLTEVLTELQM